MDVGASSGLESNVTSAERCERAPTENAATAPSPITLASAERAVHRVVQKASVKTAEELRSENV